MGWSGRDAGSHAVRPAADRAAARPPLAFTVEGEESDEVADAPRGKGVFVSNGDFYATTVVARLGLSAHGLVRAGCACYTTAEEVDRLLEGVRSLVKPVAATRA